MNTPAQTTPAPAFGLPAKTTATADAVAALFRKYKVQPISNLAPLTIARTLDAYAQGDLQAASLLWDKIERRDDKVRVVVAKRKRAVSSLSWEILTDEDTPEAEAHKQALEYLYNNLLVSDVMKRDMRGGVATLIRTLMSAIGHGYAAAEILWRYAKTPQGRDAYTAEIVRVPLWFFEAKEGRLRLLPSPTAQAGAELDPSGWLVAASEDSPLHEATCLAYLFKVMPLRDWVFWCEKFGLPWVHAKTDATPNSKEWQEFSEAIAGMGNDCLLVTNLAAEVEVNTIATSGTAPHADLVDRMDRAIVALWTGGDLNTMSKDDDAVGSNPQQDGTDDIQTDDAEFINEQLAALSLNCLRLLFGPAVKPLAKFKLLVPVKVNTTQQLAVVEKAVASGVEVSVQYYRDTFSLPAPKPGEPLLKCGSGVPPLVPSGVPPLPGIPASNSADAALAPITTALAAALPAAKAQDWAQLLSLLDLASTARDPDIYLATLRAVRTALPAIAQAARAGSATARALTTALTQAAKP